VRKTSFDRVSNRSPEENVKIRGSWLALLCLHHWVIVATWGVDGASRVGMGGLIKSGVDESMFLRASAVKIAQYLSSVHFRRFLLWIEVFIVARILRYPHSYPSHKGNCRRDTFDAECDSDAGPTNHSHSCP
jgi:hypothetical protein